MDSSDFNYRKVAGKRKRNLGLVEDSLIESFTDNIPMAKKPKLEPTATEWFHNYKPLSLNDSTTNIAPLSLPRKPLQSLPVNTTLNAARSAVKLQPKSLELLERTKKVPEITALKPTASTNKAKGRSKPRKKTRSDAPTKKKSIKTTKTTKTTRTREQELFPYEGLEIFKRIYVGGANVARDKELIDERKITAIVNATKELPNYFQDEEGFSYFKIPLQDSIDAQLIKYFDEAAEFMHEKLSGSSDNALLVHCQMGQSRSPSVIIAYAIKYMGWSLEKTWNHINDIHKDLKVNEGFKLQLMQYEKRVTGENSLDFYKKRATRKPVRYTATARSMR